MQSMHGQATLKASDGVDIFLKLPPDLYIDRYTIENVIITPSSYI